MPKRPRQSRSEAIILSRRDFGEADRLLTLFSPTQGKFRAIAKGARKPSAKVSGHVELFARCDVVIHRGRNLDIISQAELVEPYRGLREELTRGAYASYVAELLDRFTADDDEAAEVLFQLLHDTLTEIAEAADPRLALRHYELRLLDVTGFRPELAECVVSRAEILPEAQFFSCEEGGAVSRLAAPNLRSRLLSIDVDTLKLLRYLQRAPDFSGLAKLQIPADLHQKGEQLMLAYITHLLERKLQSVSFINRLRALP